MINISCRINTTEFMYTPIWQQTVNQKIEEMAIQNEQLILNVHGYKSEDERVAKAYSIVEDNCKNLNIKNRHIGFYWPASWSYTIGYMQARNRAPLASKYLCYLLEKLKLRYCSVILQGHSLGSKVILDAVQHLSEVASSDVVDDVVISAPALPFDYFDKQDIPANPYKRSYSVCWSENDPVLKYAYRLAPGNWKTPAMGSVGPKPQPLNVKSYCFSPIVNSHSGYRATTTLYTLIGQESAYSH